MDEDFSFLEERKWVDNLKSSRKVYKEKKKCLIIRYRFCLIGFTCSIEYIGF